VVDRVFENTIDDGDVDEHKIVMKRVVEPQIVNKFEVEYEIDV
jgi:hypothetical protein